MISNSERRGSWGKVLRAIPAVTLLAGCVAIEPAPAPAARHEPAAAGPLSPGVAAPAPPTLTPRGKAAPLSAPRPDASIASVPAPEVDGRVEYAVLPYPPALAAAAASLAQSDDDLLVEEQPLRAASESPDFSERERTAILALRGGVGFTASPDTFLLAAEASYFATPQLGLGPLVQLGFTGDRLVFAPTLNFRGVFDIPEPAFEPIKPFVQGGLGFVYLYKDGRQGDNDDLGFLINFGGGLDFYVTEQISVGSSMLFNFTPDKTLGDHYFFSWQVLTIGIGF